jgi:hypothetical protein
VFTGGVYNTTIYQGYPVYCYNDAVFNSTSNNTALLCACGNLTNMFIDPHFVGPLTIPNITSAQQLTFYGIHPRTDPLGVGDPIRPADPLNLTSLDLPDLVNITSRSFMIDYADELSSLTVPKLNRIAGALDFDLTGGPAINLSFPSLEFVSMGVILTGKIDR